MSRSAQEDDSAHEEEDVLLDGGTVMAYLRLLKVETWSTEILGPSPTWSSRMSSQNTVWSRTESNPYEGYLICFARPAAQLSSIFRPNGHISNQASKQRTLT